MKTGLIDMTEALNRMTNEVIMLFHHLDLFKQLNDIIVQNKALSAMDSTLLTWMRRAFSADLVVGIGRIIDADSRTQSLVCFLRQLRDHPECITRDAYVSLYESVNHLTLEMANQHFDNIAGKGEQSFSLQKIEDDISLLTQEAPCKKIRDFRDQYIAHNDAVKDNPPPAYDELFAAFETIKDIVKRYNLLLRAASMVDLTPTIQGDWQEVLTIPWIDNARVIHS